MARRRPALILGRANYRGVVPGPVLRTAQDAATPVCTECMARPRSASGFLRLSLDQSALIYPAPEHSLWP
jgi:hypothetical protein